MKFFAWVLFCLAVWLFYRVGGWQLCAAVVLFSWSTELDTNAKLDRLHRIITDTLEQWRNGGFW